MLLRLGKRHRELGHADDAEQAALGGLRLSVELSDRRRIVQLLDLVSAIAADHGDADRCGRLRGAVEAELERRPISAWAMTDVPTRVDDTAVREGRLLSLDQAVEVALGL
jgi:hypothetical protein